MRSTLRRAQAGVLVRDPLDRDEQGLAQGLRQAWDLLGLARHGTSVEVPLLGVRVDLAAATATHTGPGSCPAATAALVGLSGVEQLTIRPHLVPLAALSPERYAVLADAVASMNPTTLENTGIAHVAADLVAWLRTRVS